MTEQVCKTVKVFEYPGAIVRVHIPELSEDENRKRMRRIHDAAASLIRSKYENLGG